MGFLKKIGAALKKLIKNTLLDKTFWRFVLVGVVNTLVGLGVNYLVLWLLGRSDSVSDNTAYWVASAANYTIGSIVSFFLNKYFTFKSSAKSAREVFRFIINIIVCWIIAYGTAKPLAGWLMTRTWVFPWQNVEMPKAVGYVATLVGAALFVLLNYFGQRFFAFKKAGENGSGEAEDVDRASDVDRRSDPETGETGRRSELP